MKMMTVLLLAASLVLGACNTVQGVGKDIKQGGQAIENAGRN